MHYNQLKKYFNEFLVLDKTESMEIEKSFYFHRVNKGKLIVQAGEIAKEVHFIVKGCCRYYHIKDEEPITHWFAFENGLAVSLNSFTTQTVGNEYIQAIEDCTLLSSKRETCDRLYATYPQWERLGRLIIEDFCRLLFERVIALQRLPAKQKYQALLQMEPRIIQRVPVNYISSYLGISRETLSRVRAQMS